MNDSDTKYTVRELFDAARKGMVWRGKPLTKEVGKYQSADMWLKEADITQGIFAVKSSTMHDNYVEWCKERGLTGTSILSAVTLGKHLKTKFKHVNIDNRTHYYVNKELKENEENKKKRQEIYTRRYKKKTD